MTKSDISSFSPAQNSALNPALDVRLEVPSDAAWIEALHEHCWGPGRFARAAFRIRERYGVEEALCLVAELEGVPVANVKMAPINLAGQNGYLLGPLATDPNRRKLGAGKLLVRTVSAKAFENPACQFVLLVGDAPYYGPLGFGPTLPNRIQFPAPVDPERVLVSTRENGMVARLKGSISNWA